MKKISTIGRIRTQEKEYILVSGNQSKWLIENLLDAASIESWRKYGHQFVVVDPNKVAQLPGQVGQAVFTNPFVLVVVGDFAIEYYNNEIMIEGD